MRQIFVVMGSTGEYSDRHEWAILAYTDETLAQTHVQLAEAWDRENGLTWSRLAWERRIDLVSPYDPAYSRDYTGTSYYIVAVPLADAVPQTEVKG